MITDQKTVVNEFYFVNNISNEFYFVNNVAKNLINKDICKSNNKFKIFLKIQTSTVFH